MMGPLGQALFTAYPISVRSAFRVLLSRTPSRSDGLNQRLSTGVMKCYYRWMISDPLSFQAEKLKHARQVRDELSELPADNTSALLELPPFTGLIDLDSAAGVAAVMFLCEADDMVAARCFWRGQYEQTSTRLWKLLCRTSHRAADIGAHTGYFSLVGKASNPNLAMWSVEPNPTVFARLLVNMRANGWEIDNCFQAAITPEPVGSVRLSVNLAPWMLSSGGTILLQQEPQAQSFDVSAISIAKLLKTKPDLIKIDAEGVEEFLLLAAAKESFGTTKDMIVECLQPFSTELNTTLLEHGWFGRPIIEEASALGETSRDIGVGDNEMGRNWWLTRRSEQEQEDIIASLAD